MDVTFRRSILAPFAPALLVPMILLAQAPVARADDDKSAVEEEAAADEPQVTPRAGDDWYTRRFDELAKELSDRIATPRAAPTLYRLSQLAEGLDNVAPLAQLLTRVSEDTKASFEVRALARYLDAQVELSRGRLPRARAQLEKLQLATEGWLVGGFDNEGGTGHNAVLPVEQGPIDLHAAYAGKEREITWHKLPAVGPTARLPITDLLRPRKNATFYFLTSLDSASAQRAVLHLGTSGATKVWVNGQLAVDDAADHPARFDQRAFSVGLKKGANTVLVKVSCLEETPAIYLRAAGPGDKPLAGAKFVAPAVDAALPAIGVANGKEVAADKPAPVDDLAVVIGKLSTLAPDDGSLHEDVATMLAERRPFDSKLQLARREQEKAVAALKKDPRAWFRLSTLIDDDHNEKRAALEKALDADPNYAPARTALGRYYLQRGFARRGLDEVEKAVKQTPDFWPAQLARVDALSAMGLEGRSRRALFELAERWPTVPNVVNEAARLERVLGRRALAMERYRVILSLRHDHTEARHELAGLLADAGDVDGAAAVLRRQLDLTPTAVPTALRLAQLLATNDRPKDALAEYDRLAELAPDDETVFEARGRHRLRFADEPGAMDDFQRALVLKPQNARLREMLRSLRPQENFATPYLRDALALAAEARKSAPPKGEDAVVLAEVNVVRVYENGLSSRTKQQVIQVLTQRGVDGARTDGTAYSPGEQEVRIERARIIKPDGSVQESKQESDRGVGESGGMFFDRRQHLVSFPSLEIGDVVELVYRVDDVGSANMFADYFGDVEILQGTQPVKETEYVLLAPKTRQFYANKPKLPNIEHTVTDADDRRVWRWRATNVPKIEPEPRLPGWVDVAAYLHVSTFKEWNDVAKFWWGLVKDQLHVTPEVAAAAEEAVKGIDPKDTKARVRAVYGYVVRKTRYVGLEFGIHGFKPYKVDRVLARRFGDCKDKASLIKAMLGHLGIDAKLVLLRMRHLGHLDAQPASLAVFNHAIAYVPSLDLFLDGTAEFSGSGELPGSDQGAQVLVVEDDGRTVSRFYTTPVSKADENVTRGEYAIRLNADGSAVLGGTSSVTGQSSSSWRRAYESETGRKERFEQGWARSYPGAKAVTFEINDPRAIEDTVRTKFELDVPALARAEGDTLAFNPMGEPSRYVESFAPLSKRGFPLELGAPWKNEFSYTVRLPAGWKLVDGAKPLTGTSRFGSYELAVAATAADTLVVTGHVAVATDHVDPADYPSFRAFLEDVDRAFARRLHVAPATPLKTGAEAMK